MTVACAAETYGLCVNDGSLPPTGAFLVLAQAHGCQVPVWLTMNAAKFVVALPFVEPRGVGERHPRLSHGLSVQIERTLSP